MIDVIFGQATLDGDENFIVLDAQDANSADVFHFTSNISCANALQMCAVLNDERDTKMRMMTGKVDTACAIVFKAVDSSRAFVFAFANEEDLDAARDLAIRFWELEHYDAFAESDGEDTAENLIG